MAASSLVLVSTFLLFCTFVHSESERKEPLQCYECNEKVFHDSPPEKFKCLDEAFDPELLKEGEEPDVPIKTCPHKDYSCSKVYLSNYGVVDGLKVLITRSVRRGCMNVTEYDLGCDYDKGSQAYAWRCYCTDNKCNSASHTKVSFILATLISFVLCLLRF